MPAPFISHMPAFPVAHRWLRRHLLAWIGLSLLGALLSALGALLALRFGQGAEGPEFALSFAALLPLEAWFIPRFLARLDAEALDHPANPRDGWRAAFEERWMKAFLLHMAISMLAGFAGVCLILPGVLILILFGFAPLVLLLRGGTVGEALLKARIMGGRHWLAILQVGLVLAFVFLSLGLGSAYALHRMSPDAPLGVRVRMPLFWVANALSTAASLWVSTVLLALFHRVEETAPQPSGSSDSSGK